jgi:ribonuclease P protein component
MKSNVVTIKHNKEIVSIINKHQAYDNVTFKFKVSNNKLEQLRYVLAVNKKNFKRAVLRNKIKRQIRTFIQTIKDIKFID